MDVGERCPSGEGSTQIHMACKQWQQLPLFAFKVPARVGLSTMGLSVQDVLAVFLQPLIVWSRSIVHAIISRKNDVGTPTWRAICDSSEGPTSVWCRLCLWLWCVETGGSPSRHNKYVTCPPERISRNSNFCTSFAVISAWLIAIKGVSDTCEQAAQVLLQTRILLTPDCARIRHDLIVFHQILAEIGKGFWWSQPFPVN